MSKTAFDYGHHAQRQGKPRLPAGDVEFLEACIKGLNVGEGLTPLKEWLRGWDTANLAPTAPGLPDACFVRNNITGETVIVKRGEKGYYPIGDLEVWKKISPMELNAKTGITVHQMEAMLVGSMFGWDVPGADPAYQEQMQKELAEKKKDRVYLADLGLCIVVASKEAVPGWPERVRYAGTSDDGGNEYMSYENEDDGILYAVLEGPVVEVGERANC